MGTFPFLWELQCELGKVSIALKTVFLEFPHSLGLGNTKHVDKYVELPTKHEALLKPSQEERPKTSLTPISLIEKLEQSLDGLRNRV